jgi:hypothetical protein
MNAVMAATMIAISTGSGIERICLSQTLSR